jgi:multiple sugar transport system substrate-binding protein
MQAGTPVNASALSPLGQPGATTSITVWTVSQPDYTWVTTQIPAFTKSTGIKVNVVQYTVPEQQEKLPVVQLAHGNEYDVVITPEPDAVSAHVNNAFVPLGKFLKNPQLTPSSYNYSGIPKAASAECTYNGVTYCIPDAIDAGPQLYYNKAMFSAAGISAAPNNWGQVVADAKQLTTSTQAGICMQGSEASPNGYPVLLMLPYFLPYSSQNKAEYFSPNWTPLFNTPGSTTWATDYAAMMQKYAPKEVSAFDDADCLHAFQNGQVAMQWDDNLAAPQLWNKSISHTAGSLGIDELPCPAFNQTCILSAPYGMFVNANSSSARQTAGWQFIEYMTSPAAQISALNATKDLNVSTRPATLDYAEAHATRYGVPTDYITAIKYGSQHVEPNAIPSTPAFGAVQAQLFVVLSELETGQVSVSAGLAQLQSEFTATVKRYGL